VNVPRYCVCYPANKTQQYQLFVVTELCTSLCSARKFVQWCVVGCHQSEQNIAVSVVSISCYNKVKCLWLHVRRKLLAFHVKPSVICSTMTWLH